jgi:hypothetical protein
MIYESDEPQWDDTGRIKLEISEKNLSQCHLTYQKSHMD